MKPIDTGFRPANDMTLKTMADTRAGVNISDFGNVDEFFKAFHKNDSVGLESALIK